MADSTDNFIEISGLRKSLGEQEVLCGIDLNIKRGERLVIIGGSGSGKSVLLKHLTGLMRADSGSIRVAGTEITGLSERELTPVRRRMGVLFQDSALFVSMSVWENVAFPLRETGIRGEKEIDDRVMAALEAVGLGRHWAKQPDELSGGMRKRAGLARAIVTNPQCILYDEPTSGLDPILSDSIDRLIVRIQERFQSTAIVVTHNMKSVDTVADRVAYLRGGTIHFLGTPQELKDSKDAAIIDFVEGRSGESTL
ncbi:MAG: ATP-binding cassette domain-containing protein [Verrucomicrobiales bacterium]|nr:ATP-binding cassette domain-containing protein [Verrucomicrobiales bacterium]